MASTRILWLVIAVVAFGTLSRVSAHESATGIVKQRMDAMEGMSQTMKTIRRYIEANRNLVGIAEEANRIRESAAHIVHWFPPGSDTKPTDALPAIWQRWPDFQTRAAQLEEESAKLAVVAASGDPQSILAQFRAVGQTCSGCHADYRTKQR